MRNNKGVTLVLMALMLVLMGLFVGGLLDAAKVYVWRAEVQRAADAAALAAVSGFADGDSLGDSVRSRAQHYAGKNWVGDAPAVLESLVVNPTGSVRVVISYDVLPGALLFAPNGGRLQAAAGAQITLDPTGSLKVPKGNAWGWYKNDKNNAPQSSEQASIRLIQ